MVALRLSLEIDPCYRYTLHVVGTLSNQITNSLYYVLQEIIQIMCFCSLTDEADGKAAYEKREKRRTVRKLQEAIDARDTATVKDILQKDFDVDFRYRGQTALQLAVRLGALDICKLLMERSPNVDEADGELNSILNSACWNGYEDVAKLLIDNGANVEFENEAGSTPLHACAKKGHAKIARLLVAGNCSLNVGDRLGRTATMVAAQSGQGEVVEVLAKAGADLDWMDQQNKTPLIVAAQQGFLNIVTTLVKAGTCEKTPFYEWSCTAWLVLLSQ